MSECDFELNAGRFEEIATTLHDNVATNRQAALVAELVRIFRLFRELSPNKSPAGDTATVEVKEKPMVDLEGLVGYKMGAGARAARRAAEEANLRHIGSPIYTNKMMLIASKECGGEINRGGQLYEIISHTGRWLSNEYMWWEVPSDCQTTMGSGCQITTDAAMASFYQELAKVCKLANFNQSCAEIVADKLLTNRHNTKPFYASEVVLLADVAATLWNQHKSKMICICGVRYKEMSIARYFRWWLRSMPCTLPDHCKDCQPHERCPDGAYGDLRGIVFIITAGNGYRSVDSHLNIELRAVAADSAYWELRRGAYTEGVFETESPHSWLTAQGAIVDKA